MPKRHVPLSHDFRGSTRVDNARYDPVKKTITVQFIDGTLWHYDRCEPKVWRSFIDAGSAGRYVSEVLDHHSNGPG